MVKACFDGDKKEANIFFRSVLCRYLVVLLAQLYTFRAIVHLGRCRGPTTSSLGAFLLPRTALECSCVRTVYAGWQRAHTWDVRGLAHWFKRLLLSRILGLYSPESFFPKASPMLGFSFSR